MARPSFRIPGDIRVPTRFFARFTWKDLLRIGCPTFIAVLHTYRQSTPTLEGLPVLLLGFGIGAIWYLYKPYKSHLDSHVYNGLRWLIQKKAGEPRQVEEAKDDHIVLDSGAAVGIIEVSPTNLEMKTEAEQRALHAIYRELFETISYPVHIHSQQKPLQLTDYTEHIKKQDTPKESIRDDYLDYCQKLANGEFSRTKHYIILRVNRNSRSWVEHQARKWLPDRLQENLPLSPESGSDPGIQAAIEELDSRCLTTVQKLDTSELAVERVTGTKLDQLAKNFDLIQKAEHTPKWTSRTSSDSLGEYRRSLYISELPSSLEFGWTLTLLRTNGLVDITQTIKPRNSAEASKKLQKLSEKLTAEIDSFLQQGYRGTNKLEGLLDDTEWFLNLLADREDQPVEYGVYITVHHAEREKCQRAFEQVCQRLDTLQIDYRIPVLRTDQALTTYNPLQPDQLNETLMMPGQSAAAGFPFATQNTDQNTGVIYGVDKSDETPVLLDRYKWSSHSMARMGMVGSGKSYAAKIELLRASLAYNDLQIIVVDPKQEYKHLVRTLGGTINKLEPGAEYTLKEEVVGFTVKERGQRENVELLTSVVEQIYREASQNQRKTLVVIDEARILLNDEDGRRVLNQFVLEARDTNTAVTLITQNASHFTHSREGREILDNMPGKIFMRHDRVPESVIDYFELSQREKQELFELRTGSDSPYSEALLRVSARLKTRIKVESTSQEHAIINAGENKQ